MARYRMPSESPAWMLIRALIRDDIAERMNVRKNEVRRRNRRIERNLAAVDPGYGQSKRFAADEIGELRLPGMKDLVFRNACVRDQIAKQRAVGFVSFGALRRTHQVEVLLQW